MYLLASSITSLLTMTTFTIKFWFVVLSQINHLTSLSVLRGGCKSLEAILKFSLYFDGWLNGCVAIDFVLLVVFFMNFCIVNCSFIRQRQTDMCHLFHQS